MAVSSASPSQPADRESGLRVGAISGFGNAVIGICQLGPALTVVFFTGFIVATVGQFAPGYFLIGVVPVLGIATGYAVLNRSDPNCGTCFAWSRRAFGAPIGWIAGWAYIALTVLAIVDVASVASPYVFLTFGWTSAATSKVPVLVVGVVFILLASYVPYHGIRGAVRIQTVLLLIEVAVLFIFAVIALTKVYAGGAPVGSTKPAIAWLNPFGVPSSAIFSAGFVVAVGVYVGWESAFSANEETRDGARAPAIGAFANLIFFAIFMVFTVTAVQSFGGVGLILKDPTTFIDVLGGNAFGSFRHLLDFTVVTSSAGILIAAPLSCSRLMYSMGREDLLPKPFARLHETYRTPATGVLWVAISSASILTFLTLVSTNTLANSISAFALFGVMYYIIVGLACVFIFRRTLFDSGRNLIVRGLLPLFGTAALLYIGIKTINSLSNPANSAGHTTWLGLGAPLVIFLALLLLGLLLMATQWSRDPAAFRRRPAPPLASTKQ